MPCERLRCERRSADFEEGYRDSHDRARTITLNLGPIDVKRPLVRGLVQLGDSARATPALANGRRESDGVVARRARDV